MPVGRDFDLELRGPFGAIAFFSILVGGLQLIVSEIYSQRVSEGSYVFVQLNSYGESVDAWI